MNNQPILCLSLSSLCLIPPVLCHCLLWTHKGKGDSKSALPWLPCSTPPSVHLYIHLPHLLPSFCFSTLNPPTKSVIHISCLQAYNGVGWGSWTHTLPWKKESSTVVLCYLTAERNEWKRQSHFPEVDLKCFLARCLILICCSRVTKWRCCSPPTLWINLYNDCEAGQYWNRVCMVSKYSLNKWKLNKYLSLSKQISFSTAWAKNL